MKLYAMQTSFSGGELSPKVLGRNESTIYQQGCFTLQNFVPDSRGPALSREGTKFLFKKNVIKGRVEKFQTSGTDFYLLNFYVDGTLDIVDLDGNPPTAGGTVATTGFGSNIFDMRVVNVPSTNTVYLLSPDGNPIRKLVYDKVTDTFTYTLTPAWTGKPAQWTGSNYPRVGCWYQGRLWLGNTINQPHTFWASQSGLPQDFSASVPPLDNEAILGVTIENQGDIQWMLGTKSLVIGTLTGEYIVKSETGVLTPSDIQIQHQSSYGSRFKEPIVAGDKIFYITLDGSKLRMMEYSFSKNNWVSDDANFFADHLFSADPIAQIAWIPDSDRIFVLTDSGSAAYFVYEEGAEIHGWSPYITQGEILSAAVGVKSGKNILVITVNRDPSVETFTESLNEVDEDVQNMDSYLIDSTPGGTTTITGLDHLDGKTVQVLTDGSVHPDAVVSSGSITLQTLSELTVVGLKFTPKLVSVPLELGAPGGSGVPHFKRYAKLIVRLIDSAKPLINGTRPPTKKATTPMGSPTPLISFDDVEVTLLGWDRFAFVTIEQDLPLPLNIIGIFGSVGQEDL